MTIMTDLRQRSHLGDALRAAAQSRVPSEQLRRASPGADRVPLYSGGKLAAFVRRAPLSDTLRPTVSETPFGESADLGIERAIAARWQAEAGTLCDRVGISAADGIVHLSGAVETVHDRMALRRIAAATTETLAIIDELWVACE
ncbi:MAG: hypothetical protein ACREFP_23960 [Acetobacteraceae bacterium]